MESPAVANKCGNCITVNRPSGGQISGLLPKIWIGRQDLESELALISPSPAVENPFRQHVRGEWQKERILELLNLEDKSQYSSLRLRD